MKTERTPMLPERELRIRNAKQVILDVLSGQLTPESDPEYFEEDGLYLSVRILEQNEPEWLLQQIVAADRTRDGIRHVVNCMAVLHERARALLAGS